MVFWRAKARVLGSLAVKAPSLKTGWGEEVGGSHGDDHAAVLECLLELFDDGVSLVCGCAEGDEVVVVEVDAVGAEFCEFVDALWGV